MNITAAATQLENGIRQTFEAEKIGAHIIKIIRGPRTLTAALRLYEPDVRTLARVTRMGQSIEARAGVSPIRVTSQAGIVYAEAPSPQPLTVYSAEMRGHGLAIPLGLSPLRSVAGVDFEQDSHLLFVAPTNGGKTTGMRAVAYHLAQQHTPRQARFIISTFKPADWQGLAQTAHCGGLITDIAETVQMIEWLCATMYKRTTAMTNTPRLFVFLDDLLNILSRAPELSKPLADIASLGRGAGIHLIIGTQRLGKQGTGDAAVSGNITARVIFRTVSAQDAALFTGRSDTGAEALGDQPGDAILITTPGGVQRIAIGLITDDDLAALPQGGGTSPWQNGTATGTTSGIPAEQTVAVASAPATPISTGILRLPYRPPTPAEEMILVSAYQRKGSKNKALSAIYEQGKTPKTLDWLNQALRKVGIQQ